MFSFAIERVSDGREGTIVTPAEFGESGTRVVVMWIDDWTFETVTVEEIKGCPGTQQSKAENVLSFPAPEGDLH